METVTDNVLGNFQYCRLKKRGGNVSSKIICNPFILVANCHASRRLQAVCSLYYYTTGHDDIEDDEEDEFTDGSVHAHYDR